MKTKLGAYTGTPHRTIEELIDLAICRAAAGEHPSEIIQDMVDGYSMGWQSANHRAIEQACNAGSRGRASVSHRRKEGREFVRWMIETRKAILEGREVLK